MFFWLNKENIIRTFVHLYNQPRKSSLPFAKEGVVDCIFNDCCEFDIFGCIPVAIVFGLIDVDNEFAVEFGINVLDISTG